MARQTTVDLTALAARYRATNSDNPFTAALSIVTFVRSMLIHVIKALFIGIIFYVLMTTASLQLLPNISFTTGMLLFSIGIVPALCISVTAFSKYIAVSLSSRIEAVLLGILMPIDDIYSESQRLTKQRLTKQQFISAFLQQVIIPKLKSQLIGVFFRKKLNTVFTVVIDTFAQSAVTTVVDVTGQDPIQQCIFYIKKSISRCKKVTSKPYYYTLYTTTISYSIVWLIYYIA